MNQHTPPVPMLADSHVHLDADAFEADRSEVIARARDAGVQLMMVPATDAASWPRIRALAASQNDLHAAYGLHPMFMANHAAEHLATLKQWLTENDAIAVGEIGLDFHGDDCDPERQREYFQQQLAIAHELDLPVIVHARQALEEVILTLRRIGGLRGVVHSFSGSEQQAAQLWKLGFHLGIGGPITYPRAQRLRRIVASMPIEFLLLESDAPDQPDAAHRGQRNEPARVVEVLRCVAELRQQGDEAVGRATTANVRRLFGL